MCQSLPFTPLTLVPYAQPIKFFEATCLSPGVHVPFSLTPSLVI
jgi:hypothetical protein